MHWSRLRSSRGLFPAPALTSTLRLSAAKISNKLALRVSTTGSIFTDNVRAPHDALMPRTVSLGAAFSCPNNAWYGISWGMMGAPLMAPSSRAPCGLVRRTWLQKNQSGGGTIHTTHAMHLEPYFYHPILLSKNRPVFILRPIETREGAVATWEV
jgi:hypothetical protein